MTPVLRMACVEHARVTRIKKNRHGVPVILVMADVIGVEHTMPRSGRKVPARVCSTYGAN